RLIAEADEGRNEPPEIRAALLHQAARLSLARRKERGNSAFDEGIRLLRHAAEVSPTDSELRTRCLAELAYALMHKYRSAHEGATLDEAVNAFEAALSSSPLSKPDGEGEILSNYVAALLERYMRDGRVEDLERANEVAISSSRSSKPGTPEFAARLV